MSIESIMDATRAGLAYERMRLDSASRNIAAANVPVPAFDAGLPGATRAVHDPGNPMADAKGMVHYPNTDLVQEMTTLITASRGYEANVRSYNLLRSMVLKALELGAKMSMIDAIGAVAPSMQPALAAKAESAPAADFGQMLGEGIARIDSGLQAADAQLRAMAAGKEVAVHDVMISMEEARMKLMFMVEVRNRAVEAYQELMRMQL